MDRRALPLGLTLLLASACQLAPTFETNDAAIPSRAYGRIGEGGTSPSARFTPRLGPATNPWSDVIAGGPAPLTLGASRGTLAGGVMPDLVVEGRAIYDDGAALVALDLETGAELWRIDDQRRLQRELMTTDGETLCGIAVNTTSFNAIVVCLAMEDGRELLRDDTGSFLSTGGETQRLADLEIHDDLLFARAYDQLLAYDIASGTRLFSTRTHRQWRGLVLAGDDLISMSRPCDAGSCIAALDPRSGAVRAEQPIPGPIVYLFQHEGEAIFVNHYTWFSTIAIAYDPSTDTFRDAPEWGWASGLAGLTEVQADGKAFATGGGGGVVELDVASMSQVASYPGSQGALRVHTNAVILPSTFGGSLEAHPRGGGASTPAAALHYESWSFTSGGWYDLP